MWWLAMEMIFSRATTTHALLHSIVQIVRVHPYRPPKQSLCLGPRSQMTLDPGSDSARQLRTDPCLTRVVMSPGRQFTLYGVPVINVSPAANEHCF